MRDARPLRGDTVAIADPGDVLALAAACHGLPLFYWEQPARDVAMLGVGTVREFRADGPDRFTTISAAAHDVLATITGAGEEWSGGTVLGGFGFADHDAPGGEWREFPAARLVVPELLWMRRAGRSTLTRVWDVEGEPRRDALLARITSAARASAAPDSAARASGAREAADAADLTVTPAVGAGARWRARVAAAQSCIARGDVHKVVLACRRELAATRAVDPAAVLARARATRPSCRSFWVRHGGMSFIGSTPELLVRRSGDAVEASALAGSMRRGADGLEDSALGAALLACAKNAREHALVRAAITGALAGLVHEVTTPARPELLSLPEAHHLHTPVSGRLRHPRSVLELAGALHPTPAVCGVPRTTAGALIAHDEPDRGWYAGVVGWMDARGDGELAVALRSALIDDRRVTLWAGAGIVDGSDADAELAEVEAKMTALFRHLARAA
jgi:isochorismate synthase